MKLKSADQIEEHVAAFEGVDPDRKRQLAEHLTHLPETHLPAVCSVLENNSSDPEVNFVRGCFDGAPTPTQPPQDGGEHPGLPNAA